MRNSADAMLDRLLESLETSAEGESHENRRRRGSRRPRAVPDPHRQASIEARREAMRLYNQARSGAFTARSESNKQDLLDRFVRLLQQSGASPQRISKLKGNFDEFLRTPPQARASGRAQKIFRAGGVLLPDQGRRGSTQVDIEKSGRTPGGGVRRIIVNLKSDDIHLLSLAEAVGRARKYTNDAVQQATLNLPTGSGIVLRYIHAPTVEIQQAMNAEHFRPGSPIVRVDYLTAAYHNPNQP